MTFLAQLPPAATLDLRASNFTGRVKLSRGQFIACPGVIPVCWPLAGQRVSPEPREVMAESGGCRTCPSAWPCPVVTTIHGLVKDPQRQFVALVTRRLEKDRGSRLMTA